MARPRIELTDEQITQIEKLARHMTMDQIADFFGIHANTLRRRMQEDPRVKVAYKKGEASAIDDAGSSLLDLVKEKNVTAIIFFLKTRARWRETDHVPAASEISKLTDRELQKRRAKIGLAG